MFLGTEVEKAAATAVFEEEEEEVEDRAARAAELGAVEQVLEMARSMVGEIIVVWYCLESDGSGVGLGRGRKGRRARGYRPLVFDSQRALQ